MKERLVHARQLLLRCPNDLHPCRPPLGLSEKQPIFYNNPFSVKFIVYIRLYQGRTFAFCHKGFYAVGQAHPWYL
ncbi:hypothetical protein Marme_0899 [Marinomonas mediterranea MMB-1]|uniref:Uncharacterized protein n=1 Tax=Marinomonas mediterranea (strain ATCC 700492 / JCM 21426 / NBRC 103028 / MMB-1) TaxID=717774 RepID=F2K3S5_MARM1|nr:hypothetical protein Marme_0899 [Marinomonas mediterranea MMB-1]